MKVFYLITVYFCAFQVWVGFMRGMIDPLYCEMSFGIGFLTALQAAIMLRFCLQALRKSDEYGYCDCKHNTRWELGKDGLGNEYRYCVECDGVVRGRVDSLHRPKEQGD